MDPEERERPRRDPRTGNRMTAIVLAVVAIILGLLFFEMKPSADVGTSQADGSIAAGAANIFSAAQADVQRRSCLANQRVIAGAAASLLAGNPGYTSAAIAGPIDASSPLVTLGYLKAAPACPMGEAPYVYDAQTLSTTCPYGDPPTGHGGL
jgi:hypothetical protein